MSLGKRQGPPRRRGTRGDWDITAKAPPKKDPPPPKARKALPRAKEPMKREPLERGDSELTRTGGPKPISDGKAARRGERQAITAERTRSCVLAHLGGCDGPIDPHEIVRRSQMKESPYVAELVVGLCRRHHGLDTYRLTGERCGIRVPRPVYEADPRRALIETARLRAVAPTGIPYWWSDDDLDRWAATADRRAREIRS